MSAKEAQNVLGIELTKEEFADAMGLKSNSLFVENMFGLCDTDRSGYVNFREFLDIIVIFAKGTGHKKNSTSLNFGECKYLWKLIWFIFGQILIIKKSQNVKLFHKTTKINYMFLRHFFQKMMWESGFFFFFFYFC